MTATKRPRGGSVRVRGTCPAGHVTETTSPPGRVTWHGPCATAECTEKVYAKRVPVDRQPPDDPDAVTAPPSEDDNAVREVRFDVPPPRADRGRPKLPDEPPAADPEQQPVPAADGPPPAPPVILEPERPQQPKRPRGGAELVAGRERAEKPRRARVWRHPLDW